MSQYLFHLNSCYDYKLPAERRNHFIKLSKSSDSLPTSANPPTDLSQSSHYFRSPIRLNARYSTLHDEKNDLLSRNTSLNTFERLQRKSLVPIQESSIAQREEGHTFINDPKVPENEPENLPNGILFTEPLLPKIKLKKQIPAKAEIFKRKRNFDLGRLKGLVARENIDNMYYDSYLIRNITMQKVTVRDQLITLGHKFFHLKVQFIDENLLGAVDLPDED